MITDLIDFNALNQARKLSEQKPFRNLLEVPNIIKYSAITDGPLDVKVHLLPEIVFRVLDTLHPNTHLTNTQKGRIYFISSILNQAIHSKPSGHESKMLYQFFIDYNNDDILKTLNITERVKSHEREDCIRNLEINLKLLSIVPKSFDLLIGDEQMLPEFEEIDLAAAKLLSWILLIRKDDFESLEDRRKAADIILGSGPKNSKLENGFYRGIYKMFPVNKQDEQRNENKEVLFMLIAYIKCDWYWFFSSFYELNDEAAAKLSRLPIFINWKYLLADFYQRNKKIVTNLAKTGELKQLIKKELKPICNILRIPIPFTNACDSKNFSARPEQKDLILQLLHKLSLLKKSSLNHQEAIIQLKSRMFQISLDKLKSKASESRKWGQPKNVIDALMSPFRLKDFFLENFEYIIGKMGSPANEWITRNNYLILAEYYYSKTFDQNMLSDNSIAMPESNEKEGSMDQGMKEDIVNLQNLIRNCLTSNKNSKYTLQTCKNVVVMVLEGLSRGLEENPANRKNIRFVVELMSIISGFDFLYLFDEECHESNKHECQHCSLNQIEHIAQHIAILFDKLISDDTYSNRILPKYVRIERFSKLTPDLIGINLDKLVNNRELQSGDQVIEDIDIDDSLEEPMDASELQNLKIIVVNSSKAAMLQQLVFKMLDLFLTEYDNVKGDMKKLSEFIHLTFREIIKLRMFLKRNVNSENRLERFGRVILGLQKLYLKEYDNIKDIIQYATDDREKGSSLAESIEETMRTVDIKTIKKFQSLIPDQIDEEARNYVLNLFDKIKQGKAQTKDIFKLLDDLGDGNGRIGTQEFEVMTKRLGTPLSQHRIREIFSDVKMDADTDALTLEELLELDEDEWLKALEYLKRKRASYAMKFMGTTPVAMYGTLIYLLLLIALIFSFVFVGIKAFALGGAFGAVINSILPGSNLYTFRCMYNILNSCCSGDWIK